MNNINYLNFFEKLKSNYKNVACNIFGFLIIFYGGNSSANEIKILTFHYPPYMDTQRHEEGLAIDIVKEAFYRMKIDPRFEFYPLARDFTLFENGYGDAMFSVKKTPVREKKYIYSKKPLFKQKMVFFARAESSLKFNGNLNSMGNISIGVLKKATYGKEYDKEMENGTLKKLEFANSDESNFKKLLAGRMDLVICGSEVGLEILNRLNSQGKAVIIGPPISVTGSYIAFKKNQENVVIAKKFDDAIESMRLDGTLSKIKRKYTLRK